MELGRKWLEADFESNTRARNPNNGYRMLILNGHNSHCTYEFANLCLKHRIVLVCLPPHTTHRLQPCDVGVFGPLALNWKSQVNMATRQGITITKQNFLEQYHHARARALTPTTITASFSKCGIWPLNPSAIEDSAFEPALNTTIQPAMPVAATVSPLLVEVPPEQNSTCSSPSSIPQCSTVTSVTPSSLGTSTQTSTSMEQVSGHSTTFKFADFPPTLPVNASHKAYTEQCQQLRDWTAHAKAQMEADYALMKLMEQENGRLRHQVFNKTSKKAPKWEGPSDACHMTGLDMLVTLAKADWEANIADVHDEAKEQFKQLHAAIRQHEKAAADEQHRAEQERLTAERAATREAERARKTTFDFVVKRIASEQHAVKKVLADAQKAVAVAEKRAAVEAKCQVAANKRQAAEEKRQAAREKKQLEQSEKEIKRLEARTKRTRARGPKDALVGDADSPNTFQVEESPLTAPPLAVSPLRPRPRPRLVQRQAPISSLSLIPSKATQSTEEVESGTNDKENGDGGDGRLTRADTDHDVAQT